MTIIIIVNALMFALGFVTGIVALAVAVSARMNKSRPRGRK